MRRLWSQLHMALSWLVLAACGVQFFLAGLGVFGATSFWAHTIVGNAIWMTSVLLLVISLVGWTGRPRILLTVLLFAMMLIQSWLPHVSQPWVAAIHPALGIGILFVALKLFRLGVEAERLSRATATR